MPTRLFAPRRALAVLAVAAALTACGIDQASDPTVTTGPCQVTDGPVAVAVASRANTPAAEPLPAGVVGVLDQVVRRVGQDGTGPEISLIAVDGAPFVVGGQAFQPSSHNDSALAREREAYLTEIGRGVAEAKARTGEADILRGLDVAARQARAQGAGTVVLVDSGLQTVAPLDFREPGLLQADPTELAEFLRTSGSLPDLSGLTVLLYGIGDTAAPQEPLGTAARSRLVEQWSAIVAAGGATCSYVDQTPRTGAAPSGSPAVSIVDIDPPVTLDMSGSQPIKLTDGGEVGFVTGKSDFRDPDGAAKVLRPLAGWLAADPARGLHLTGTTARSGTDDYQLDLSRQRAERVRRTLADLGADPSRVVAVGVGSRFPQYVHDAGPDSELLPGPAAENRSVIIELQGA